ILPNNAMACSRKEWLWSPNRAGVRATDEDTAAVNRRPAMRIYIIGNEKLTVCREPPVQLNEHEITVTSREELHAASLNGKQLLALWNTLPGVEKRRRVGHHERLIDELWSAMQFLPDPDPPPNVKRPSKQDAVIAM